MDDTSDTSIVIDMTMSSPASSGPDVAMDGSSMHTPTPTKRKGTGGEETNSTPGSSRQQEKRPKTEGSGLVELKNGKLKFSQSGYTRAIPRRRMHTFEGLLIDAAEADKTVTEIPEDLWDVIVMAGHELSSSNEALFVKHLKAELVKGQDPKTQDALIIDALTPLVPKLFTLRQYGLLPSDFGSTSARFPAALQIRCWEATSDEYFPADKREEVAARRRERECAREECVTLVQVMSEEERSKLVKPDKSGKEAKDVKAEKVDKVEKVEKVEEKESVKEVEIKEEAIVIDADEAKATPSKEMNASRRTREGTATTADSSRRSMSPTKKSKLSPEEIEARRIKQEERDAIKNEKLEKKAAKEREEQKKLDLKKKQAQAFGSFFKSKPKAPESPIPRESPAGPSTVPEVSDFAKTFKGFVTRANVSVAPLDPFAATRKIKGKVSGKEMEQWGDEGAPEVRHWTAKDFLREHLQRTAQAQPVSQQPQQSTSVRGLKSAPRYGSVGELWAAHQEAVDPRAVLRQLRDNSRFPWKTLAFDQQLRPPYSGTFTKRSLVVGPRTPFAHDPLFDYSYDSGDDWAEEEEGGEDVDDFERPAEEEEDAEDDDEEGEFDDWLDDTEDVEYDADEDGDIPMLPQSSPNRLPYKPAKKVNPNNASNPPKRVTKVTPYWRGPVWEAQLGEPVEGLHEYRIQLLNEAPVTLDPFTYVATEPAPAFKATFSDTVIGTNLGVKCLLAAEQVVMKLQPAPTTTTPAVHSSSTKPHTSLSNGTMPLGDASASANKVALSTSTSASRAPPKIGFPSSHLLELLRAIEGNTKIRTDLVSALRERFDKVATKAAIEAKISEVAIREGKSKDSQWKVKAEAWEAAGVVPPLTEQVAVDA